MRLKQDGHGQVELMGPKGKDSVSTCHIRHAQLQQLAQWRNKYCHT